MLPNFIVIGAPRAGTTWIHANLLRHPQVYVPKIKELHFFDTHYSKGLRYYRKFFRNWSGEPAIGEVTPDYLHGVYTQNDVPALIHRHLPSVKLIASLRDPVERLYSRYWNSKAKYKENAALTFEQKIKTKPEFIEEGYYFEQLTRYYNLFPKDQILVLLFDDIKTRPTYFMAQIYGFLGVHTEFEAGLDSISINASAGKKKLAKSKGTWLLSRGLYRVGLRDLSERMRLLNSATIPPMKPDTRAFLGALYAEHNRRLSTLIDRDLSHWTHTS